MRIQPAVRRETAKIALGTGILTVLMIAVFLILRRFDWTVLTGALLGYVAAVGNFFLMALTVQKAADEMKPLPTPENTDTAEEDGEAEEQDQPLSEDAKRGKRRIQVSYILRMLGMAGIAILGVALPCFHPVATLLPMLFPRIVIALEGAMMHKNQSNGA